MTVEFTTAVKRKQTNAERQAKWRLAHQHRSDAIMSPPGLPLTCIPRGNVHLDEVESSARGTMALYDKLLAIINNWVDRVIRDPDSFSNTDALRAFALLGPLLESLMIIREKIAQQRASEAHPVSSTSDLPTVPPRITETLELLKSRFDKFGQRQ